MSNLYLVKYLENPILVSKDSPVTIGRSESNAVVLSESRVSRKHAQIEWKSKPGEYTICDLESSNGTFVNNKKISGKPVALHDGDKIRISTAVYTVRMADNPVAIELEFKELRRNVQSMATEIISVSEIQAAKQDGSLTGDLANFCPIELFQMLETGCKTGELIIRTDKEQNGSFIIINGQIIAGKFGSKKGEDAVYEILKYTQGKFTFKPEFSPPVKPEINMPTTSILMEGCRLLDEFARAGSSDIA